MTNKILLFCLIMSLLIPIVSADNIIIDKNNPFDNFKIDNGDLEKMTIYNKIEENNEVLFNALNENKKIIETEENNKTNIFSIVKGIIVFVCLIVAYSLVKLYLSLRKKEKYLKNELSLRSKKPTKTTKTSKAPKTTKTTKTTKTIDKEIEVQKEEKTEIKKRVFKE